MKRNYDDFNKFLDKELEDDVETKITPIDVLEALSVLASIHKTTKIDILKYTHPDLLVKSIDNILGNMYDLHDIFSELRFVIKTVFDGQFKNLPFISFWRIDLDENDRIETGMTEKFLMKVGFEWIQNRDGLKVFTDGYDTVLSEEEAETFFSVCDTITHLTKDDVEEVVYRVLHGKEK